MAIIRIVMQVKQQQFRTDYIEQQEQTQRQLKEQKQQMSQQNSQESNRQEQQEESGVQRRRPARRQVHMIDHGEERNSLPVPEEIRPFLNMIQLEEENPQSTVNHHPFTNPQIDYKTVHPSQLQVRLHPQPPTTNTKETVYEKILIYGIVWHKEINGLFDYEEKDKNEKSTIVIEEDVKSHINFVSGENVTLPREEDCFLLIFRTKMKKLMYEKNLLKEVRIAALRRLLIQSKQLNEKDQKPIDKEFLCAFKLVMNSMTNQFSIKVYSFDELCNQFKMISKLTEEKKEPKFESIQEIENIQVQNEETDKKEEQPIKQVPVQSHPFNMNQTPQQEKSYTNEPYFIIRTLSKNSPIQSLGCKLYPGDLIKMGKVEFKVISIDGVSIEDKTNEYDRRAIEVTQIGEQEQKDIECKYCLGGKSQQENNFFVHLCNCRGHIGYVHYNCLTTWTTTRASIQTSENVKMYYLEKMKCEVCTKEFPKYFKYDGKLYHILPIDLPEKHLLLVDVSQKQDATTAVITGVQGNSITIGRGRNAHLRVTDITVSRQHATITKIGEDYYVKDCKSKFGTLVRSTQKQIETDIQHKKGFQISNVIFTVQIIKKEVEKEKQTEKVSEKVLISESIKEEKQGNKEGNESFKQKSTNNSMSTNNSISTMFKKLSETNQGPSFELQKLNPHTSFKQEIKRQIQEEEDKAILQEQQEQTRSNKNAVHLAKQNHDREIMKKIEKIQQIRRQLQKRIIQQHSEQQEKEEEQIQLQNYQNTTNVNTHQQELIGSSTNEKPCKTKSRRIHYEDDEDNEPREN